MLAAIDDDIDALEDEVVARPADEQLQHIFSLKRAPRRAAQGRHAAARPLRARRRRHHRELPGPRADSRDYFRDVYDHLIRISDLIDSYRDLLTGAMDVYLSTRLQPRSTR